MAVPSYTTDLTSGLIHACDASSASWTEPTGFAGGAITLPETDYYIQNTGCLSKNCGTTTPVGVGAIYNYGSGISIPTNGAMMTWLFFGAPNTLDTQANGGLRVFAGSATSAFKQWYVKGSNTYQYGGWICIPVNPAVDTGNITITVAATAGTFTRSGGDYIADGFEPGQTIVTTGFTNGGNNTTKIISTITTTVITVTNNSGLVDETGNADERVRFCDALTGASTTTLQYLGAGAYIPGTAIASKGNPFGIDVMRFGRCESRIADGSTADGYATFNGFAATNDNVANRWGLIQEVQGGYLVQGLVIFGYSTATDFRDSNKSILIANTEKVTSAFNGFEVRQSGSRVDLTSVSFLALGTVSKGNWVTTDNADINIESCTFTDMGTFGFLSNSTINNSIFRRTNKITTGGATFSGCTIDSNISSSAMLVSSPANAALISNTTFISDGTGHGIEIGGTAANITLTNLTWNGYAGSDGSSGNEAVYINIGDGSMNLTISGGTTPSVRTAGCTVTVISNAVDATVTVKNTAGTAAIENAMVLVLAVAGGSMPSNVTVTISNSGTTATVTHNTHGMATNDKVQIKGASHLANNGVFSIIKINNDSYSYTMGSSPGSNPTGTIKCHYVALSGLTNASGVITMSRVFASNQPITGKIRKSTGSPLYKTAEFSGVIDSTSGFAATLQLIGDE